MKQITQKKTLAQYVFDRRRSLDGVKTLIKNISVRSLTLLIFAVVWALCGRPRVSDATAVTFSVKCLNPLKLYPLPGSIFRKWFGSYSFICLRAFHNNVISNGESDCCNDTFTDVRFTSLLVKNILKEYKLFLCY